MKTATHAMLLFPFAFLAAVIFCSGSVSAETIRVEGGTGQPGLHLLTQGAAGVELHYEIGSFAMEQIEINGDMLHAISLPGVFLPNDAGAPDLPGIGRFLALPQGATATLEILNARTQVYNDIEVAPAPVIPRENDDSPLTYQRNPIIYEADTFYPENPVRLSEQGQIRGVDVVTIGITPFQYNPVSKVLTVYTELDIRISFNGGTEQFGDDRFRTRYWEPILRNHLLNYASLTPLSFNAPGGSRDGYEYVIICPDNSDFIPWADTLKTWRKLQGITTEVFTTTETGNSPSDIENFLNDCYNNWQTDAFLILGDYPFSGDGNRDIGVVAPLWNLYCASDNIYADVDFDDLPDMAHGRITARDAADLEIMIPKLLSYEREPYTDPGFYQHPIFAGGWQTERWFILCAEAVLGHQVNVLGKDPVREYAIYSGTPGMLWSTNPNTNLVVDYFGPSGLGYIPDTPAYLNDWGGNSARLNADINAGAYLLLHRDHGNHTGWGEPHYNISHLSGLNNDMYPFVFSINCLTGMYNWENMCFTEAFHRMNHGALGLIAASHMSYSFVNDTFVWGMFDGLWPGFMPDYPLDSDNLGLPNLRPAFGMVSGKYFLQSSSWPYNPGNKVETYHLFHHHGDVFTTMYSEIPQDLTVIHYGVWFTNTDYFPIQADEGSIIALTVDGEIIGVADATGAQQNVPIIPQTSPGILRITVTKANYFRYDVTVPIVSTLYVVKPDGTGDFPTIQDAIDAASTWTLIQLTDGTYTGEGNRDLDFLGKSIMVRSQSGNPEACVIDCEGDAMHPHRGFLFHTGEDAQSLLEAVTVTHGYAPDAGGGISCVGASPTITGCIIADNWAQEGAGIYCGDGSPTITYCTLTGNSGDQGGGLLAATPASSPSIEHCTFSGNVVSSWGGALAFTSGASGTAAYNIIRSNQATLGGGGIIVADAGTEPHIEHNTILENFAPAAGGLNGGGGICFHSGCAPAVSNNIIVLNAGGGAMHCSDASPTVGCNNLWNNVGGDALCGIDAGDNISTDPLFCGEQNPEDPYALDFNSPCAVQNSPACGQIGARPVGCGVPEYACCVGDVCQVQTQEDCASAGGQWQVGFLSCDPNPCLDYACCIGEECQLLSRSECNTAGGDWQLGIDSCDPNPCLYEFACCFDEVCQVLTHEDCTVVGGDWLDGIETCDPDPCPLREYACCVGAECQVLTEENCVAGGGWWQLGTSSCDPNPCVTWYACCLGDVCQMLPLDGCANLGGEWQWGIPSCDPNLCELPDSSSLAMGVFIAHAPPGLQWTSGEDWCQRYLDEFPIASSSEQVNQVEIGTEHVWYVLAGWEEDKEFCAAQFGFGDYSPDAYMIYDSGPCYPETGGLELPTGGWPGPNEGTALTVTNMPWSGNYVPIYWFGGYAYSEDQIQLGINEAQGFGGFSNCLEPRWSFDATCFGALGIAIDGAACHPGLPSVCACCIGEICQMLTLEDCTLVGGEWQAGLESCDPNPCVSRIDPDARGQVPANLFLSPCHPNPFHNPTRISYGIPASATNAPASLRIYDPAGRLVRTLLDGPQPQGTYTVIWDGTDDRRQAVAGGIYFYQLRISDEIISRRVVLVR